MNGPLRRDDAPAARRAAAASLDALLHFSRRRRTPVVLQAEASECGLACIVMVANHHGNMTDLATARRADPPSRRGATLANLSEAATRLGLVARAIKVEPEDLQQLALPAVLHWDFDHFVVLVAVRGKQVVIHDPACGARRLPLAEVSRHLTGVCLELRPGSTFRAVKAAPRVSVFSLLGSLRDARGAIVQVLVLTGVLELLTVASPLLMQVVVDQAIVSEDRSLLSVLGLGFLWLAGVQVAVTAARAWVVMVLSAALSLQVLTGLFAHLLSLPMPFFEKRHVGDVSSRFESLGTIQRTLTGSFVEAVVDGSMALITAAAMLVYSPALAAVVMAAVTVYAVCRLLLFGPQRLAQDEQIGHAAQQLSSFLETVRCMQSVKLFNRQLQRGALYAHRLADNLNAGSRIQRLAIAGNAANGVVFGIENIAVVWLGAAAVLDGSLSLGMLFAFIAFKQQFAARTAAFVDKAVEFRMLGLHAERVGDIALAAPEKDHAEVDVATLAPSVEFRNVSFRYAEADAYVLRGVSLRIEAGESVAIVGPSGCGKTTLFKLLLGLLEPTEGEILIGGMPIVRLGLGYRDLMGAVMQDDELLSGSIAANISFFDPQPDAARVEACARAAAIESDILAMPMGYNTLVGGVGAAVSGGQKQRLLLARALYKQPRILVLDEATSHLDSACEHNVNEAVRRLALTRIMVAHRAETIATAGRVIAPWQAETRTVARLATA